MCFMFVCLTKFFYHKNDAVAANATTSRLGGAKPVIGSLGVE